MSIDTAAATDISEPSSATVAAVHSLLFREARLLDTHSYVEWLSLWTPGELLYWVPGAGDPSLDGVPSIVLDDRSDLEDRTERLAEGWAMAHYSSISLCRSITNIEVETVDADQLIVHSVLDLTEIRDERRYHWTGRVRHELRVTADGLAIAVKRVDLVDRHLATPVLAFLL